MHFGHLNVNGLHSKKEELRPLVLFPPYNTYIPLPSPSLNNSFHVITKKKIIFSCTMYSCTMLILILIDIHYSQKAAFSTEKFEWSKSLLLRFPPPSKKLSPSNKISDSFPQGGRNFPHPLALFGKPWY